MFPEASPEQKALGWATLKRLAVAFVGTVIVFRATPFVLGYFFPNLAVQALGWQSAIESPAAPEGQPL
jgi:uncharacterized membrane protein YfbV (UPF0208 family)